VHFNELGKLTAISLTTALLDLRMRRTERFEKRGVERQKMKKEKKKGKGELALHSDF